jgi:hypothetical protein
MIDWRMHFFIELILQQCFQLLSSRQPTCLLLLYCCPDFRVQVHLHKSFVELHFSHKQLPQNVSVVACVDGKALDTILPGQVRTADLSILSAMHAYACACIPSTEVAAVLCMLCFKLNAEDSEVHYLAALASMPLMSCPSMKGSEAAYTLLQANSAEAMVQGRLHHNTKPVVSTVKLLSPLLADTC